MSENSCFRRLFKKRHGKRSQTLFQSESQYLYHIKQSLIATELVTADEKYYLANRDNLTQHIQMALSKKQKMFSEFFLSI